MADSDKAEPNSSVLGDSLDPPSAQAEHTLDTAPQIEAASPVDTDVPEGAHVHDGSHAIAEHPTNTLSTSPTMVQATAETATDDAHNQMPERKAPREDVDLFESAPRTFPIAVKNTTQLKEDVAEAFNTGDLYDMYRRKLQILQEKGEAVHDLQKPKLLVRSLLDYINTYEDRMKSVEDKLGISSERNKPTKGGSHGPDVAGTRFYDIENPNHMALEAPKVDEDDWDIPGAFCSTIDPQNHIRALFRWKVKPNDGLETPQMALPPDPAMVEILELRLRSKPVAEFFRKELDYDISRDGVVHIAKPFRCLIRNMEKLRQHVDRLGEHSRMLSTVSSFTGEAQDRTLGNAPARKSRPKESFPDASDAGTNLNGVKELLDFVKSYLVDDVNLFQEYKNGTRLNISFNNLWMLFDSNDTIFCPLKKGEDGIYAGDQKDECFGTLEFDTPQVFRVLATFGGISRRFPPLVNRSKGLAQPLPDDTDENNAKHIREKWTSLYLDCYLIEFDGVRFRAVSDSFEFKPFEGELLVTSLEAYPIVFHENTSDGGTASLIRRAFRYADLTSVQHVHHKGLTLGERKEEINSPVIVDFKSAYQHDVRWQPESKPIHIIFWGSSPPIHYTGIREIPKRICNDTDCHKTSCLVDAALLQQRTVLSKAYREINIVLDDYRVDTKKQVAKLKEDMKSRDLLHLLPGAAYAFALRNRKWVKVDIENLGTVKQEDNWDDLVLPPGHKDMVQAMVETFTSTGSAVGAVEGQDDYDVDLVPGKGKGCIILLHGEPGVGKTSTAECVAAYTKRPLYPITCGDIGTTPTEVEQALDIHFSRAHKWGCVLLLDEADVFLAKRNRFGDDIKRNGLVSVFLRTLEYYSGILFLTTNRVGSFDDAFRSRIHIQLYYPKLTKKQAVKIWKTNISRLKRHNEDRRAKGISEVAIDKKKIIVYAKDKFDTLHWNGRQIRNAFQTAVALAEFEARKENKPGPEVTKSHFRRVAKATKEFDEYLMQVNQGYDEEKIALRDQDRVAYTPLPRAGTSKPTATAVENSCSSESESSSSSGDVSSKGDSSSSDSEVETEGHGKKTQSKTKKSKKHRDAKNAPVKRDKFHKKKGKSSRGKEFDEDEE